MSSPLVGLLFLLLVTVTAANILAPTLKWTRSGCAFASCPPGWYGPPSASTDGVFTTMNGTIIRVNPRNGLVIWQSNLCHGMSTSGIVIGDINGDSVNEVVVAHWNGCVVALDSSTGQPLSGWPVIITNLAPRSLILVDVDNSGQQDVVIDEGAIVLRWDGSQISFSPVSSSTASFTRDRSASIDINGDAVPDLLVPTQSGISSACLLYTSRRG